jgi:hypothetical protein
MEMLLDQLAGLNIIQLAAISNSTCYNGMDSYHYSKRLLRQFRHHISYVYRTYMCAISAVLK